MGDGANDLLMMQVAGLSVAYHAKLMVLAHAQVALNHSDLDAVLAFWIDGGGAGDDTCAAARIQSRTMPAANQLPGAPLALLRINNTGLVQGVGGSGFSTPVSWKSPPASSVTGSEFEVSPPQNRVAATCVTPPIVPMALVAASNRPSPRPLMRPSCRTRTLSSLTTQLRPPGAIPITSLRTASPVVTPLASVAGLAIPATGSTPIPPSKRTRLPAAIAGGINMLDMRAAAIKPGIFFMVRLLMYSIDERGQPPHTTRQRPFTSTTASCRLHG